MWGGGKPPGHNQNSCIFLKKETDAEYPKWKNMQKYFVTFLPGYLLKTWTFLDIWMDIFIKY